MAIDEAARNARTKRPAIILFDLGACPFHQLAVFHPRRTRCFAGAAMEAVVDMPDERVSELQTSFIHQDHLTNAAAGRIRFETPQAIRGAMVEAQAAVNAMQVVHVFGAVRAVEAALATGRSGGFKRYSGWRCLRHPAQMPPR